MKSTSRPARSYTRFFSGCLLFHVVSAQVSAQGTKCPDGGYALTPSLYEDQPELLSQVTCIPEDAFRKYDGNITLTGLENLKDVGKWAFAYLNGTLIFTGAYPKLQSIHYGVFYAAGNSDSRMDFQSSQLDALTFVNPEAFHLAEAKGGRLTISLGAYPNYKGCTLLSFPDNVVLHGPIDVPLTRELYEKGDATAIRAATCIPNEMFKYYGGNVMLFGLPQLTFIGEGAFLGMADTLVLKGAFPNLQTIKSRAFTTSNEDSEIDFSGGTLDELTSVHTKAFRYFKGRVTFPPAAQMSKYVGCTKMTYAGPSNLDSDVLHGPNSIPLTTALYEASVAGGTTAELNKATCIANNEFKDYLANVTIQGLPNLVDIGDFAFSRTDGELTFSGGFPKLQRIGERAFEGTGKGNYAGRVEFSGLPSLFNIGDAAFYRQLVIMTGSYPKLETIDSNAFAKALPGSAATFALHGMESLVEIERQAFLNFPGKLLLQGKFPNLISIEDSAFKEAGTGDSVVDIECSSGSDMVVHADAFDAFKGDRRGRLTESTPCMTTTVTSTATTATTSTTTTTAATAATTTSVASVTTCLMAESRPDWTWATCYTREERREYNIPLSIQDLNELASALEGDDADRMDAILTKYPTMTKDHTAYACNSNSCDLSSLSNCDLGVQLYCQCESGCCGNCNYVGNSGYCSGGGSCLGTTIEKFAMTRNANRCLSRLVQESATLATPPTPPMPTAPPTPPITTAAAAILTASTASTTVATPPSFTAVAPSATPRSAVTPPSESRTTTTTGTIVTLVVLTALILLIVAVALWWFKCRPQTRANNAVHNPVFSLQESCADTTAAPPDPGLYGTLASSSGHSQDFYERVVVADAEVKAAGSTGNLLQKLDQIPAVELQVAVDEAAAHCDRDGHFDFVQPVQDALAFANNLLAQHVSDRQQHDAQRGRSASLYERPLDAGVELLPDGFNATDAATVHVYTQPTPLYGGLNGALGGWGDGGTAAMKHYMSYAKLMMTACKKLPTYSGRLFRGVCLPPSVVLGTKGVGDILELQAITSTSRTSDVLRDADFLGIGEEGAAQSGGGERTVLQFAALSAVEISRFSALGDAAEEEHGPDSGFVNEDEVLLLPGTRFKIDKITKWHFGVVEVQLHQLPPTAPDRVDGSISNDPAASDSSAASDPLGIYSSAAPLYENINTYLAPADGSAQSGSMLPPYVYNEMHGEHGMVVSLDPASNAPFPIDQGGKGGSSPVHALTSAARARSGTASVYDVVSTAGNNVDVLVATATTTGGAAIYSIPLDTGNDFATYDRTRADTMQTSSAAPSTAVYATYAGLHESAA